MLEALSKKQKIVFFIVLSIMILFILYYIYSTLYKDNSNFYSDNLIYDNLISKDNSDEDYIASNDTSSNLIVIYICGAVKESKVITLPENSRISDAIEHVGGLETDADISDINLASILEDGEKVYIPYKGELIQNDSPQSSSTLPSSQNSSQNKKININKATQTELESIPGIGPSTALKIINYRNENGKFKSIEDIKSVSGIGEKKYESIKDYISIK